MFSCPGLFETPDRATGLPGRMYGSEGFDTERTSLFAQRWIPAGVGAWVPNPGDIHPVELGGWPLILVRALDGTVKCFINICRHRGTKLVSEACKGHRTIRCPFHSWTYALDGKLLATPNVNGYGANDHPSFVLDGLGLKEVPCGRWLDWVFVNLDGEAGPFESHIGPLKTHFAKFDLSSLTHGRSKVNEWPFNWKIFVEGGIENYHVPYMHPQAEEGRKTVDWRHDVIGECAVAMSFGSVTPKGIPIMRDAGLPACPSIPPGEEHRSHLLSIFPTGFMTVSRSRVALISVAPSSADVSRVSIDLYFFGDGATSPAYAAEREKVYQSSDLIGEQDLEIFRRTHLMARVRDDLGIQTRFSPFWEQSVYHFQQMYARALSSSQVGKIGGGAARFASSATSGL